MRKLLLAVRLVAEAIFGLFVLLTIPTSLLKTFAAKPSSAYLIGSCVGAIIMLFIGVWLIKDVVRIARRLKAPPIIV